MSGGFGHEIVVFTVFALRAFFFYHKVGGIDMALRVLRQWPLNQPISECFLQQVLPVAYTASAPFSASVQTTISFFLYYRHFLSEEENC